jgi:hypothetical protein
MGTARGEAEMTERCGDIPAANTGVGTSAVKGELFES